MSDAATSQERPLRLLALDGGGIRGYSELKILETIMHRIAWELGVDAKTIKPCDYFDLIGGTSTGGIIAVLLARLRMTVGECLQLYAEFSQKIFKDDSSITGHPTEGVAHSRFDAEILKKVIKDELEKRLPNPTDAEVSAGFEKAEAPLYDPSVDQKCKAFVLATPSDRPQFRNPHFFRTYEHRQEDDAERQEGSNNDNQNNTSVKIWEALRATSAATTFFDPIKIGEETFVDGGLGCNNPAKRVYEEAQQHWEGRPIGCLISLGTGMPKAQKFEDPQTQSWWQKVFKAESIQVLTRIATECESTHREMLRVKELKKKYFRFNVQQGLQDIPLEAYGRLSEVAAYTTGYLGTNEINCQLDEAVEKLI